MLEDDLVTEMTAAEMLARLPPVERDAIRYRYLFDYEWAEVGEAMGLSGPAVRYHVRKGLKRLTGELEIETYHTKYEPPKVKGNAKLSPEDVMNMRQLYETGEYSYHDLAKRFDVHWSTVQNVITRKTWKDVPGGISEPRPRRARLTPKKVRSMRRIYANGKHTLEELAERFNTGVENVRKIVRRERWKGYAEPD